MLLCTCLSSFLLWEMRKQNSTNREVRLVKSQIPLGLADRKTTSIFRIWVIVMIHRGCCTQSTFEVMIDLAAAWLCCASIHRDDSAEVDVYNPQKSEWDKISPMTQVCISHVPLVCVLCSRTVLVNSKSRGDQKHTNITSVAVCH